MIKFQSEAPSGKVFAHQCLTVTQAQQLLAALPNGWNGVVLVNGKAI